MKNVLLPGLVALSLIGLTALQFYLLRSGLLLEKARLEGQVEQILDRFNDRLNADEDLRRDLLRVINGELRSPERILSNSVRDTLRQWLAADLAEAGASVSFSFALKTMYFGHNILYSENYRSQSTEYTPSYRVLNGKIREVCHCVPVLYFRVENLFQYLLQQLAGLALLSLVFILLLTGCLLWLIRSLGQLRRLDLVKNDFINNLTHELKTPVFSSKLLIGLLRENLQPGKSTKTSEYLRLLEGENAKLGTHIEKVLELASLQHDRTVLRCVPAFAHPLLEQLSEQFKPLIRQRQGRFTLQLQAHHDCLSIDPGHFCNAVQNLLDNALKYSPSPPDIRLTTRNEGNGFVIEVNDQGTGIPQEHQAHVFKKFYRVPVDGKTRVKGYGLGLNYVQQVIRGMSGSVSLKSRPGRGSTFRIRLPVEGKTQTQMQTQSSKTKRQAQMQSSMSGHDNG